MNFKTVRLVWNLHLDFLVSVTSCWYKVENKKNQSQHKILADSERHRADCQGSGMFSKLWILALFWTVYNPRNSMKAVCQLSLHICPKTLPTMHFCFSNGQLQCKWMWSCKHNVQIVATLIYLETLLSMLLSYGVVIFFLVLLNTSFRVAYDSVRRGIG